MEEEKKTPYDVLRDVQTEIIVKKSHENKFGGFKYRNAEDIYSAVKPLEVKHGFTLAVTDRIEAFGDRLFIHSIAVFNTGISFGGCISSDGYAEIDTNRKGMDKSQATGAASSYARKYALSGLFLLDDGVDADMEPIGQRLVGKVIAESLHDRCKGDDNLEAFLLKAMGIKKWTDLINDHYYVLNANWDKYVKKYKEENA